MSDDEQSSERTYVVPSPHDDADEPYVLDENGERVETDEKPPEIRQTLQQVIHSGLLDPRGGETIESIASTIELGHRMMQMSREMGQWVNDNADHYDAMPGDISELLDGSLEYDEFDVYPDGRVEEVTKLAEQVVTLWKRAGITHGLEKQGVIKSIPLPIRRRTTEIIVEYDLVGTDGALDEAVDELTEYAGRIYRHPKGRHQRIVRLLFNFWSYDGPDDIFRDYATRIAGEDVNDQHTDRLARRIFEAVVGGDDTDKLPLDTRFRDYIDSDTAKGAMGRKDDEPPADSNVSDYFSDSELDGMLGMDAIQLEWLHEWTEQGFDLEAAKDNARERWKQQQNTPELLGGWVDPDVKVPTFLYPIEKIAEYFWDTEVKPREQAAHYTENRPVRVRGSNYARAPKPMAEPIKYQKGVDPIDVDDTSYQPAPAELVARYRTITSTMGANILPKWATPEQLDLGVRDNTEGAELYRGTRDIEALMGAIDAKTFLFLAAHTRRNGLVYGTVEEITKDVIAPGLKSRLQSRNYRRQLESIQKMIPLVLFWDDGTYGNVFDLNFTPGESERETEVAWGFTRGFEQQCDERGAWRGEFLFNIDGVMEMTGKEGGQIRHYITACDFWNRQRRWAADSDLDPDNLKPVPIDEWAAASNALSRSAATYLDEQREGGSRSKASQERTKTWNQLQELDDRELIDLDGDKQHPRILPPTELLEAWRKYRNRKNG